MIVQLNIHDPWMLDVTPIEPWDDPEEDWWIEVPDALVAQYNMLHATLEIIERMFDDFHYEQKGYRHFS